MDKKEEKGILQSILANLSSLGAKDEVVVEEVVEEIEVAAEVVAEVSEEIVEEAVEVSAVEEVEEVVLSEEKPEYATKKDLEDFKVSLSKIVSEAIGSVAGEKKELEERVVELSAEPAAKAIVHSPENEASAPQGFRYGSKRPKGTYDVVMEKLNGIN